MASDVPSDTVRDPGSDTQGRFRYQAACVLLMALDILDDNKPTIRVYAERVEDALLERGDGTFVPVSIKSRASGLEPYALTDKEFYKPLARFAIHEKLHKDKFAAYMWAVSAHGRKKNVDNFFEGFEKIAARPRATLVRNVIGAAKIFGHDITESHVRAAAAKTKLEILPRLNSSEPEIVARCSAVLPILDGRPHSAIRRHVHDAITYVQACSVPTYDIFLSSPLVSEPEHLDRVEVRKKCIDAAQLHKMFGVSSGRPDAAERVVKYFSVLSQQELSDACANLNIDVNALHLAETLLRVTPDRQYAVIHKMYSLPSQLAVLIAMRRVAMHVESGGIQILKSWAEHGSPICVLSRSLGFPWFVEEMAAEAGEELCSLCKSIQLDPGLETMDDDDRVIYVKSELQAYLRQHGALTAAKDVNSFLAMEGVHLMFTITARADVSDFIMHLKREFPSCFFVVEADPELDNIVACDVYPTPPHKSLRAASMYQNVLLLKERNKP